MKINWKVRFRNKTWLASFIALLLSFVYSLLGMFEVALPVEQDKVMDIVATVLTVLGALGVIIDPTTPGVSDSERAMSYTEPGVTEPPDAE